MIEFYKYFYEEGSATYKYQKYIPEMEKSKKCVQLTLRPVLKANSYVKCIDKCQRNYTIEQKFTE